MSALACDVHREAGQEVPAIGVCNALGPMSSAFCRECLSADRVPYSNLVAYLSGVGSITSKADLAEWTHGTIDATLAFFGKTWDDFVRDCAAANAAMDAYFREADDAR